MKRLLTILIIIFSFMQISSAQEKYEVKRININDKYDDFGPQVWKNFLVFISERRVKAFAYNNSKTKKGVTNILKAGISDDSIYFEPSIFSDNLLSNHDDGPVSFTSDGSKIYYGRPLNISNAANVRKDSSILAGIFTAEFVDGEWVNIKGMPFNNPNYIISQPAIAPDESFIIFSSTMPGFGMGDLFISYNKNGQWSDPENLGIKFNTGRSELYPFIHYNGDLYYSSNGFGEREDLDIYRCAFNGKGWDEPEILPAPFNSDYNDISFYINYSKHQGYFSSDREGSLDIYHFEKTTVDHYECPELVEESFCFDIPESNSDELNGLPLKYKYFLNDQEAVHVEGELYCFPEVGSYKLELNIVDTLTGKIIFTREHYEFLIERVQQPFIHSADSLPLNGWVNFDTKGTYLPGLNIDEYLWDFGDESGENGESARHFYASRGEFRVTLTIFGKPINGEAPKFCAYKNITVLDDVVLKENIPINKPLDLTGFIRLPDYSPLPDNLYYNNLVGSNVQVKMAHILKSKKYVPLKDERFANIDTSALHIFKDDEDNFNYYYGAAFSIKDAYSDYLITRKAGFVNAKIVNFRNTRLNGDEFYIQPKEDRSIGYAVVLKKSKNPIDHFEELFADVSALGNIVEEIYVSGQGYYYIVGNYNDINDALTLSRELELNGQKSIRIRDFSMKSVVSSLGISAGDIETEEYMVELFRSRDYLDLNDSIFKVVGNRKIIAVRQNNREVAYFVNGGDNLLAVKNTLEQMRKKGFNLSHITNFKYERLDDEGFYISTKKEEVFSFVITFEIANRPINLSDKFGKALVGYKVYETYDPVTKKYVYRVDVGKELSEGVMLSNDMKSDSISIIGISKLVYNPLTDDEFYLTPLEEGENQFVIVLGVFDEKQNIYKTFKNIPSFRKIQEIYDAEGGKYTYIIGGYGSLESAYAKLEEIKKSGILDVYIRRFIYDTIKGDQFFIDNVNEEIELFRITLQRDSVELSAGDSKYDQARYVGDVISVFDSEKGDFVIAVGKSVALPEALNNLGAIIEDGYDSPQIEKYVYSSMDKDRFAIRDINKDDQYFAVQLFESDTLVPLDGSRYMRRISRKYNIISKYDEEKEKYIYLIGDIKTKEGANKYYNYALEDGFANAKIVSIIYETLAHDEFTIHPVSMDDPEYVVNLLRTQKKIGADNEYFNDIPSQYVVEEVYDEATGFYNYLIKNAESIHEANNILARVKKVGYLTAHVDKLIYSTLKPMEFTLEPISDDGNDFSITLIRSKEKLGVDNPIFDKIRSQGTVTEYYDYKTKEYIYSFGKTEGMLSAFENLKVAQDFGFEDSKIQKFVYSELSADHFYLETIEQDESMFTIVLAERKERFSKEKFEVFEDMGYDVREKFIESRGVWVYSLSLTDNVAEAEKLTRQAQAAGFDEARLNRFVYTQLSTDDYYLEMIEEDDEIFMIVLTQSKERRDINTDPLFENLDGRYKVEEIYDEELDIYKYYIGTPMKDYNYANAMRKELNAMGYLDARIIQFKYSILKYDEFYIEHKDESAAIGFVLSGRSTEIEPLTIYFGFDQYYLSKKYQSQIDELIIEMSSANFVIVLEGHADDIGEIEYNLWLSKMRARSVKKYMVEVGVESDKITIVPKGESDPIVPNTSFQNRRLNRSVIILPEKE
jgi:outer membrane protein OmpA-like peptidoglycan-associated protein